MNSEPQPLSLRGCAPFPLSHYLKALGVIQIVAEQADPNAKACWASNQFVLYSCLNQKQIETFFLNEYSPSPIVAPWNGGSGFNPKDNQVAIREIRQGEANRFSAYRAAIEGCMEALARLGIVQKVDAEQKPQLLLECRNVLSDNVLHWLDSAVVLTGDGPKYPPLLGTGGNDGRLDFTNNFMQRLCDLIDPNTGAPTAKSESWLIASLFGDATDQLQRGVAIGQFDPASAGGANSTAGYDAESLVNPWDYVLMLEGALLFAAAAVKKLEDRGSGALGYPFCVRPAGVGYGSASLADEDAGRAEIWLPLWSQPASLPELRLLFSEGRATVNRRAARSGVDFARAVASLGVDRGIEAFERYGFHQRNGLSFFAVPLGRFKVSRQPQADLINELDANGWLDRFRRAATSKTAPARARLALRRLENSILELCQRSGWLAVQNVLMALGQAEEALAVSSRWREATFMAPVPLLLPEWLAEAHDGSTEFRLAASLASIYHSELGSLRRHMEPIELRRKGERGWATWSETPDDPAMVWGGGGLTRNLIAVLRRRVIEAERGGKDRGDAKLLFPGKASFAPGLGDIAKFIESAVDDERIEALLKGLILIDWDQARRIGVWNLVPPAGREPFPGAAYALLKLCHLPKDLDGVAIPLTTQITHRAAIGDIAGATMLAARRLRASGFPSAVQVVPQDRKLGIRTAAALMFPVWDSDVQRDNDVQKLKNAVIRPAESNEEPEKPELKMSEAT
jgi:CRISPR-associated protein Csx17